MNNFTIYTTHYQLDKTLPSDNIKPIHVGSILAAKDLYPITDAVGDNISAKNSVFCELTAHYWVWKNQLDSDYIGFMHHRRHLCFNHELNKQDNAWGMVEYPGINEQYIKECHLDEQSICDAIKGYDLAVAEKWDVSITGAKNNYELYSQTEFLHIKDYDLALAILREKHPEYDDYINRYNASSFGYYTNIFVMKKNVFCDYAEWIFPILFELENQIDISNYSNNERRVIGHIAERLVGIYLFKLIDEGKLKVKELRRTIVNNTEPDLTESSILLKAEANFNQDEDNYVPIVVNFNQNYAHVAAACIQSIITKASDNFNYDIFILGNKVEEQSVRRYREMVSGFDNINLTYIELSTESFLTKLYSNQYFSIETYFRLFIPRIFSAFKKVIYLDVDMIVNEDISNLTLVDIDGYDVAAVQCYVMQGFIKNNVLSHSDTGCLETKDYLNNYVKINNPDNYIQAGLVIFNIPRLIASDFVACAIKELDTKYWFLDQDILNKLVDGNVKLLPYNWNVLHGNLDASALINSLPASIKDDYIAARQNPSIIHYAGPLKPWDNRNVEFSDYFWKEMMKTIWFSDMVFDALTSHYQGNKKVFSLQKGKHVVRKGFDLLFPSGSKRRVIFAREYKKMRSI